MTDIKKRKRKKEVTIDLKLQVWCGSSLKSSLAAYLFLEPPTMLDLATLHCKVDLFWFFRCHCSLFLRTMIARMDHLVLINIIVYLSCLYELLSVGEWGSDNCHKEVPSGISEKIGTL